MLPIMARPRSIDPKAPTSRTVVLGVRFSERQLRELRKQAKASGVKVAELVRTLALSKVKVHHTGKRRAA
jgi:hypothetical protein